MGGAPGRAFVYVAHSSASPLSNMPTPIHEEIDESDDEAEKRVLFVAQFYNFLELRGSPIEDAPLMGGKEIDLYALYNAVQELGGCNRVTKLQLWNEVLIKLNLQGNPDATPDTVKEAYVRDTITIPEGDYVTRGGNLNGHVGSGRRGSGKVHRGKRSSVAETVPALSVDPEQVEQDEQAIIADAANEITNQGVEDSSGYDKRSPTAESVPARSEDRERAEQCEQATSEAGGNGTTNQGDEVGSGYATWKTKEKKVPVMKNSVLVDASYAMSAYGGFYSANGIDDGRPELEQDAQTQCSDDIFESCSPIFEEPTIREVVEIVETTAIDSVVHRCSQQPSSSKVICPSCSAAQSDANCSMDYQEDEVLLEGPEVVVKTEGNDYESVVDEDMEGDLDLDIDFHTDGRMVEVVTPMEHDFETEIMEQENNSDTSTYYVDSPSLYSKQPIVKKNIGLCDILQLANVKLEKLEK
nr:AT-rich interaction region domain containing protein [Haemonchus contortus]